MADASKKTDGPSTDSRDAYNFTKLPDWDNDLVDEEGIKAFVEALAAPDISPSQDDLSSPNLAAKHATHITALNDWRPVRQKVRKRKKAPTSRIKDETREGFVYTLTKWPLFFFVMGWIVLLFVTYLLTRLYIWMYEHFVAWRGKSQKLRRQMNDKTSYQDWKSSAQELDTYLGNDQWKETEEYAYYDSKAMRRVVKELKSSRRKAEAEETTGTNTEASPAFDDLCALLEGCVKNNFLGTENPRLYSETYYGTKNLVQAYVDETEAALALLHTTKRISIERKRELFKHIQTNLGRTALCLSGGATFAYYHFGVAKALLDADLLPEVITGTSGGALVAGLLATRTNEELKKMLVPALAYRITACEDAITKWLPRWWRTGARFDTVTWAKKCSWFCNGNMTFREAYRRTGRILNVSCVPSDPHSPTILTNYLTSPDCVIWSAVLASAAVPGILNPVVLMKKKKDGTLEPYSFGTKWKDGSLRTDIPLKALNLHFNVNFSIVSQVNPHVNLFFFSSRGTVGRPVTHRKGRGWRGGFLGSATEQYLKLDLNKWLKVLRHLELLPRPMDQDWSMLWLQRFNGTITLWPKSRPSDFLYILSDPGIQRLGRMIHVGQLSIWPKLKFIGNRMKIERQIEKGRRAFRSNRGNGDHALGDVLSEDDLRTISKLLAKKGDKRQFLAAKPYTESPQSVSDTEDFENIERPIQGGPFDPANGQKHDDALVAPSPTLSTRFSHWWNRSPEPLGSPNRASSMYEMRSKDRKAYEARMNEVQKLRRSSTIDEMERQTQVFFDDTDFDGASTTDSDVDDNGGDSHMPTAFTYTEENPFEDDFGDEVGEPDNRVRVDTKEKKDK